MENRELRVLQLVKGLDIGNHSGGSDKFGLELAKEMKCSGVNIHLACMNIFGTETENAILDTLKDLGIPVQFIEGKNTLSKIVSAQLADYCRENQINIIHSHFQVGTLATIRLKQLGYKGKIVRTAHIDKEWGDGVLAWLMRQLFTKRIFPKQTDLQTGVSQNIVDSINAYPATKKSGRKALVIHNGILKNWFLPIPNKSYPTSSKKVIGSIGLLIERKGFQYLIEAMPQVLDVYPESELIIVGEGPYRSVLEQKIQANGLENKVSLLGLQTNPRKWLEKMDLFVLPSLIEGLPTVIIESMARGVPVIASDIAGNNELIIDGESGWLFKSQSVEQLANKIIEAFRHSEEYEKISAQAYNWAHEFTIENAAKKYLALYDGLFKDQD